MRTGPALQGRTYLRPIEEEQEVFAEEQTIFTTISSKNFFRFNLETAGFYLGGALARGIGVMNMPKISYEIGVGIANRLLQVEEESTFYSGFYKVVSAATGYFTAGKAQEKVVDPITTYIGSAIGLKMAGLLADVFCLEGTTQSLENPFRDISRKAIKTSCEAAGGYLGGGIARGAGLVHIPELLFSQTLLGWIQAGIYQTYVVDFITDYVGARIGIKLGGVVGEVLWFSIEKMINLTTETSTESSIPIPSQAQVRAARIAHVYKDSRHS
jgi:hypothetical protein